VKKVSVLAFLMVLFLSCKPEKPNLPDPLEAGWEGKKVCEVLEENDELRILKCTFPPGVGHETHYHPPHVGYTLKGGTFKLDDIEGIREVTIPKGYTWIKDSITTHTVQNTGNTTAVFLIIEYK
jgi:quercetin dioxygenase-like cupin family protein